MFVLDEGFEGFKELCVCGYVFCSWLCFYIGCMFSGLVKVFIIVFGGFYWEVYRCDCRIWFEFEVGVKYIVFVGEIV